MTNFDKILKKGVDSAQGTSQDKWSRAVASILYLLQQFNGMYNDDKNHHVAVKHISCKKCHLASFLLMVRQRDNPKNAIKFHINDWKSIDAAKDEYLCNRCK